MKVFSRFLLSSLALFLGAESVDSRTQSGSSEIEEYCNELTNRLDTIGEGLRERGEVERRWAQWYNWGNWANGWNNWQNW